jgi:hypothetical protein
MRIFAILILFCTSLFGAESTTTNIVGDITTKIFERTGVAGKPDLRIETVYRGDMKVLQIMSHRNEQGAMVVVSRSYFVDGKLEMVESDNDGDGCFESVAIFNPKTEDFEMFTRQKDGTVKPISTEALATIKKKKAEADESVKKMLQESAKEKMSR